MIKAINSSRYDEIIDKITVRIGYYEKCLEYNKYILNLANGDSITLTLPKNHIPHLLGVYTDKLKAAGIVRNNVSTYNVLKKLINSDITFISMKNSKFDVNTLFSEYVDEKIETFIDTLKVRYGDIYCIIKYSSDRTYTTGEEKENSDYFIIRKHDKKYSALGIVKSDKENTKEYLPVTSRLFNNYEELKEFLSKVAKNQEITYPVNYRIENYDKSFSSKGFATLEEKVQLNKTLKEIADNFGAIPSTNRDFMATIDRLLNNRQKSNNYTSILTLIRDAIIQNNIIDIEEVRQILDENEIPSELQSLIDSCNDLMCSNHYNSTSIDTSYSSIQNENITLKEKLEAMKKELLELKSKNASLENENIVLKESNESTSKKLKVLTDAFESIR